MPTTATADATIAIHPPHKDTAKIARDMAEVRASGPGKSEAAKSDKLHASKEVDAQRGPTRPKPRAVISADPAAAEERYINREQLRELIPASDMTVWRWQHDPKIAFPLPLKLGAGGRNFWWLPAIRAWLRRREAGMSISAGK
jgi:predicted DNA-binding transcriptional regulator AlpA